MILTTADKIYLAKYTKQIGTKPIKELFEDAKDIAHELTEQVPGNRQINHDAILKFTEMAHYLGILEKKKAQETSTPGELALVVTGFTDPDYGLYPSIHREFIRGLKMGKIRFSPFVICHYDQLPDLNTFAMLVNVHPDSAVFQELKDSAKNLKLDIRVTTNLWFKH